MADNKTQAEEFDDIMQEWLKNRENKDDSKLTSEKLIATETPPPAATTTSDDAKVLEKFAPVYNDMRERMKQLELANATLLKERTKDEPKPTQPTIDREQLLKRMEEDFPGAVDWAYSQRFGFSPMQALQLMGQEMVKMRTESAVNNFVANTKDYDNTNPEHVQAVARLMQTGDGKQVPCTIENLTTAWALAKHHGIVNLTPKQEASPTPTPITSRTRTGIPSTGNTGAPAGFTPNRMSDQQFEKLSPDEQLQLIMTLKERADKIASGQ